VNEIELRKQLDAAKTFKVERIAQVTHEVEVARRDLQRAEERLSLWVKMIPADVMQFMREEQERNARYAEQDAEAKRLKDIHAFAVLQSRRHGKGILPPESHSSKQTTFGIFGLGGGGLLAYALSHSLLSIESNIALLALGAVGSIIGFVVGSWSFDQNFVEDESLRGPLFENRM
jgi:hypothetical protein